MARQPQTYDELEVRLEGSDGAYRTAVRSASGASARGDFALPVGADDVAELRLGLDPTALQAEGPEDGVSRAEDFGAELFSALIATGKVRDVYRVARRDARQAGRGLRVTLHLSGAPDLGGIPWELLHDRPSFLAQSTSTPVVRYLDIPSSRRPLRVAPPIRVLGLISRPTDDDLPDLDADEERERLEGALESLVQAGLVELRWLESATLRAVQREIDHGEDFHVFHYIGHGEYDERTGQGAVVLEREDGSAERVTGHRLGQMLTDRQTLRLAVLNSCEGARTAPQDPFAGVAASLLEWEIPAVIGMQFAITDSAAILFAEEFYSSLAEGSPVDAAVTTARRALATTTELEWSTPVLFLRVADGRLFDMQVSTLARHRAKVAEATPQKAASVDTASKSAQASSTPRAAAPKATSGLAAARVVSRVKHGGGWMGLVGTVSGVAFSPDGTRIATASADKTACVWDVAKSKQLTRVTHEGWVSAVAFHPDGEQIVTASNDESARLWDVSDGSEMARLSHGGKVSDVAFSAGGAWIATASADKTACVWDVDTASEVFRATHEEAVTGVAFSPNGDWVATASDDKTACIWEWATTTDLLLLAHEDGVNGVAFDDEGERIATISGSDAFIWDARGGHGLLHVVHDGEVNGIAFSQDGSRFATASADETARVWSCEDGRELSRINHASPVSAVAFSPDGELILTGANDKTARIWALPSQAR